MPAGSSRSFSYFRPYPVVFERGAGSMLWDVDDNRYIDFANNGLSLIHGNAYPADRWRRSRARSPKGTAWPGASRPQIEFAEVLASASRRRAGQVRQHRHRGDDAGGEAGSPADRQAAAAQGVARIPRLLRRPLGRARGTGRDSGPHAARRLRRRGVVQSEHRRARRSDRGGDPRARSLHRAGHAASGWLPQGGRARWRRPPGRCSSSTTA